MRLIHLLPIFIALFLIRPVSAQEQAYFVYLPIVAKVHPLAFVVLQPSDIPGAQLCGSSGPITDFNDDIKMFNPVSGYYQCLDQSEFSILNSVIEFETAAGAQGQLDFLRQERIDKGYTPLDPPTYGDDSLAYRVQVTGILEVTFDVVAYRHDRYYVATARISDHEHINYAQLLDFVAIGWGRLLSFLGG